MDPDERKKLDELWEWRIEMLSVLHLARIIGLLLGIAIASLTLLEALRRFGTP